MRRLSAIQVGVLVAAAMNATSCFRNHGGRGHDIDDVDAGGEDAAEDGLSADGGADDSGFDAGKPDAPDESCAAQDAIGEGTCLAIVGTFWNGYQCITYSGCSCVGEDCDESYASGEDCVLAHENCDRACGGGLSAWDAVACLEDEYCDLDGHCGIADEGGFCVKRPTACDTVISPVCGCDGQTYDNNCAAHTAGTAYYREGGCESDVVDCRATGCPDGSSCEGCRTVDGDSVYFCLEDGTAC